MNATIESLFGPPSDKIEIPGFIQAAEQADYELDLPQSDAAAQECSVSSIRDSISNAWNNPTLSAYLVKTHENSITSLYSSTATRSPQTKLRNKPIILDDATSSLQASLDNVKLTAYETNSESATFIRPSKHSDHNALAQVKLNPEPSARIGNAKEAILTVSVHTKSTWASGNVNRSSQHALLSTQTLADLLKVIPCRSNEIEADDEITEAEPQQSSSSENCFICIEDLVYADGVGGQDYAQKLMTHLQTISKGAPAVSMATTTTHETLLSSLLLRINRPYWIVHKGNCEHFLVVDQIRFQHPSDFRSGYPLTLQITPPLLDLCRACTKVPAVLAITGDIRLGESPCLLCRSCWRHMGEPPSGSDMSVVVKEMPRYNAGWQSS